MDSISSSGTPAGAPQAQPPSDVSAGVVPKPRFAGFPAGRVAFTPVPDLLFSELLPLLQDAAELKVTLHLLWLLHRKRGNDRTVSRAELESDGVLRQSLAAVDGDTNAALRRGLDLAVNRGALLCFRGRGEAGQGSADEDPAWYMLNTAKGRDYMARLRAGRASLPDGSAPLDERPMRPRPTVFALYEQNVGPLQPLIAEELDEAQRTYPPQWIEDAFRVAAENNARNWRYVRAVLERWRRQGRDTDEDSDRGDRKRYITGEYEEYRRG